jgi:hypothetical protein
MATFYLNHESELYHYGVKGMKWGSHKSKNDYIYTRKKYDNGRIWAQDKEKLAKAKQKKVQDQLASVGSYSPTTQGQKEASAKDRVLKEQAVHRRAKEKHNEELAERARIHSRDRRHREVDAQKQVLAEQEKQRKWKKARQKADFHMAIKRNKQYYYGKK